MSNLFSSRSSSSLLRFGLGALSVGLLALSLGGCKNKDYPKCKKDKHCNVEQGEKCVDGMC